MPLKGIVSQGHSLPSSARLITSPLIPMINRLNGLGFSGVVVLEDAVVLDEVVVDVSPSKQALSPETQLVQLSSKVGQSDVSTQRELSV